MASRFLTGAKGILAATALGGVIAAKYPLYKLYQKRKEKRLRMRRANRLQFSKLPRHKQGQHLSYHRRKLRDKERIYKQGYTKIRKPAQRRHRLPRI